VIDSPIKRCSYWTSSNLAWHIDYGTAWYGIPFCWDKFSSTKGVCNASYNMVPDARSAPHPGHNFRDWVINCKDPLCSLLMSANINNNQVSTA